MSERVEEIIKEMKEKAQLYSPDDVVIATICSHSSLQLFNAANREGFKTLGIIRDKDEDVRRSYDVFPYAKPDNFVVLDNYLDFVHLDPVAADLGDDIIFIPHGSGVEYLKEGDGEHHGLEILPFPTYGNRRALAWEASRAKQREWLENEAGLLMPKEYLSPEDIDGPVIIKLKGAPGGRGAVILASKEEYHAFMDSQSREDYEGSTIQQFIPGTRYYLQFFGTPFDSYNDQGLEFFGIDRRDESDIDEAHKLGSRTELLAQGKYPTFNVTGNVPAVLRESILMRESIPAGRKVLEASRQLFPEGLIGPYCLETVVGPDSRMHTFEISARIVAGSNVLVNGSPYRRFTYGDEEMNYADRMMEEIRYAVEKRKLDKIVT